MVAPILIGIFAVLTTLWEITKAVSQALLDALKRFWDVLFELLQLFQRVMPSWLNWIFFIIFVSFVGGFLVSFFLSFQYSCNDQNELRSAQSVYSGIVLFWEMSIINAQSNSTYECVGNPTESDCTHQLNYSSCQPFINLTNFTQSCVWDNSTNTCNGIIWNFFDCNNNGCCKHFNQSLCSTWSGCSVKNFGVSSSYIESMTNPVPNVASGSIYDVASIKCMNRTPKIAIFGLDIFNYEMWILIMFITVIIKLIASGF